jgi:hypothetical protein
MESCVLLHATHVYIFSDAICTDVCGIRRHVAQLRLASVGIAQPTVISEYLVPSESNITICAVSPQNGSRNLSSLPPYLIRPWSFLPGVIENTKGLNIIYINWQEKDILNF